MHILFLTDNFPPEVNAPASRTFEHCREWVEAGNRVTVVTCAPNFPVGKVYRGYHNRLVQEEEMDGIRVIRVWSYITANEGFFKRILDYCSYAVSAVIASGLVKHPDLVIGTSPQFFTVLAAFLVSRIKGIPFVFELRDLWPESIKVVGAMRNLAVIRLLEKLEMLLYGKAALIVSVTESFRRILVARGIEAEKIEVITNGVDISRFRPMPKDKELAARYGLTDKFVAGYVGTHGMAHALDTILEAAEMLGGKGFGDAYRFILLGNGALKQQLMGKARAMGLENLIFIDSVPKEQVARYWSLLDASIIHLRKSDLFRAVIPSKLFESMGMGVPMLHGVAGESAEIVDREHVGLTFEPENARELSDRMVRLKNDPQLHQSMRTSCSCAARNYERSILARRMLRMLTELADGGGKNIAINNLLDSKLRGTL